MAQPGTDTEFFKPGERARYSGEYQLVDEQGNVQGGDLLTLDEGDVFPDVEGTNVRYQLHPTCEDEPCEPIEAASIDNTLPSEDLI